MAERFKELKYKVHKFLMFHDVLKSPYLYLCVQTLL